MTGLPAPTVHYTPKYRVNRTLDPIRGLSRVSAF
jgi:hypothetical protein